jgi:hypothetical protein
MNTLIKLLMAAALLLGAAQTPAQTTISAPQVLVCPVALWPPAVCPKPAIFNPITANTYAAGSVSKTAPVWLHTYSGYAATDLLIACPTNAIVSADGTKCTNSAGADASVLTALSAIPKLSIAAPAVPVVTTVGLSWTAPTQNSDGTALTDLKGYNVYQGTSATSLVKVGSITPPTSGSTVGYTTPSLGAGTYYFSVTAFNSANAESAKSPVVSTTIAPPPTKTPGAVNNVKITVSVTAGP